MAPKYLLVDDTALEFLEDLIAEYQDGADGFDYHITSRLLADITRLQEDDV